MCVSGRKELALCVTPCTSYLHKRGTRLVQYFMVQKLCGIRVVCRGVLGVCGQGVKYRIETEWMRFGDNRELQYAK